MKNPQSSVINLIRDIRNETQKQNKTKLKSNKSILMKLFIFICFNSSSDWILFFFFLVLYLAEYLSCCIGISGFLYNDLHIVTKSTKWFLIKLSCAQHLRLRCVCMCVSEWFCCFVFSFGLQLFCWRFDFFFRSFVRSLPLRFRNLC